MKRELLTEILNDAAQASEDAFERALMNSEVFDAFNQALDEGLEKVQMLLTEREISYDPLRMEKDFLNMRNRFYDKVYDIMFKERDGIITEFCERIDELTDKMSKEFSE